VTQQYLPVALQGKLFYQPSDQGYERAIGDDVARRREAQLAAMIETGASVEPEILTTSPRDRRREAWLQRAVSNAGRNLARVRERLFVLAGVQRHHLLLVLNAGSGLLTWEAVRQAPEGGVWALAGDSRGGRDAAPAGEPVCHLLSGPPFWLAPWRSWTICSPCAASRRCDLIACWRATRSAGQWGPGPSSPAQVASWLQPDGGFCFAQVVPRRGQRLSALVDWDGAPADLERRVREAEETIYHDESQTLWSTGMWPI
jgi:putative ATPase